MAVTKIICADNSVIIKSGKTKMINAVTDGNNKKEKRILYSCGDFLSVDGNGKLIAEKVREDKVSELILISAVNQNIRKVIPVTIKVRPLSIVPNNARAISGGNIKFSYNYDFPIDAYWSVLNHDMTTGNIDSSSGDYFAPYPIIQDRIIQIELRDQNTGDTTTTNVLLQKMNIKVGSQSDILAGSGEQRLNILVHYTAKDGGRDNFGCNIISNPKVGSVRDGGYYTPPALVNKIETVQVEAFHKDAPLIRGRLSFNVVPACPKCRIALNGSRCSNCNYVLSNGLKECPRCHSIDNWNGTNCSECGYPRLKRHYPN